MGFVDFSAECYFGSEALYGKWMGQGDVAKDDILFTTEAPLGNVALVPDERKYILSQRTILLKPHQEIASSKFLFQLLLSDEFQRMLKDYSSGSTAKGIQRKKLEQLFVAVPPLSEQYAIARALSDVDALLDLLDRLIAKKRNLKQAAMQQLLTGQTRLPGFSGEWEVKTLGETTDSLDNLRVPLNESQREKMKGDYPYCGANGVLGFVDNYVVDDDIILMAEDGGYFDEYETRPIAYRMTGKCWVNNHAHILKAKPGFDQGFLFYSLVHKNILPFLASGTRAKLNKSEMNKIEVRRPKDHPEQTAIAEVLTEMDGELAVLEQRREKTRALKQAMMQELLTGRTRLVSSQKATA
jgi:type I restriction enzyme S subunit